MKRRAVIFTAAAAAVFSFCAFHYENAAVFVGHITGKPGSLTPKIRKRG